MKLLNISKICLIYIGNLEQKNQQSHFRFSNDKLVKKKKLRLHTPISTSSKSLSKGEENRTLPTIENTFIITIRIKTQPLELKEVLISIIKNAQTYHLGVFDFH